VSISKAYELLLINLVWHSWKYVCGHSFFWSGTCSPQYYNCYQKINKQRVPIQSVSWIIGIKNCQPKYLHVYRWLPFSTFYYYDPYWFKNFPYLYIYKGKFLCLSLTLSVTPITRLQLPTSTFQPSNAINLISANFKFIGSSSHGVQFALCSRLKKKTLSNIPLKPQQHL